MRSRWGRREQLRCLHADERELRPIDSVYEMYECAGCPMTRKQAGGRNMTGSQRGKLVAAFRYPVRVEIRRPEFKRSASLAYIDVAKLGRAARAEFEVGHFE